MPQNILLSHFRVVFCISRGLAGSTQTSGVHPGAHLSHPNAHHCSLLHSLLQLLLAQFQLDVQAEGNGASCLLGGEKLAQKWDRDVDGVPSYVREAPLKKLHGLFGHCPNNDCPPPPPFTQTGLADSHQQDNHQHGQP